MWLIARLKICWLPSLLSTEAYFHWAIDHWTSESNWSKGSTKEWFLFQWRDKARSSIWRDWSSCIFWEEESVMSIWAQSRWSLTTSYWMMASLSKTTKSKMMTLYRWSQLTINKAMNRFITRRMLLRRLEKGNWKYWRSERESLRRNISYLDLCLLFLQATINWIQRKVNWERWVKNSWEEFMDSVWAMNTEK